MWKRFTDQLTPQQWNDFVRAHGPRSGQFLQSWEWGEFQTAVGERVERWINDSSRELQPALSSLVGVATIIKKSVPGFGSYAYLPRGPIVTGDVKTEWTALADQLTDVLFVRSDVPVPQLVASDRVRQTVEQQPAHTRITSLSMTSEELFQSLPSKTRYNIRLAQKQHVHVRFEEVQLDDVWPLFEKTSARGEFRLHQKMYYQTMLNTLTTDECRVFLASAWKDEVVIAANVMLDFGQTRTYLHGASAYEHRALMGPHLLHWTLLDEAMKQGMKAYDWWGVAPEEQPAHPWAGLSRFKRSFSGEGVACAGTFDLVKRPVWYTLYALARQIRRLHP